MRAENSGAPMAAVWLLSNTATTNNRHYCQALQDLKKKTLDTLDTVVCTLCGSHLTVLFPDCFPGLIYSQQILKLKYSGVMACFATSIIGFYLELRLCLFKWVEIILMAVTSTTGIIRFLCTLLFHHLKQVILVSPALKRF